MNKIEFINSLMNNEKLSLKQKERVFNLIEQELIKFENSEEVILEDIKLIKEKLGLNDETELPSPSYENPLPKYITPQNLYSFLYAYNQHDILKYTCHTIDDEDKINTVCEFESYKFQNHLELILSAYSKLESSFFVSHQIKNLIRIYLNGISFSGKFNLWSEIDKIEFNWSSIILKEWAQNNAGKVLNPEINLTRVRDYDPLELPNTFESKLNGNTVSNFSDLVKHFKNLIHIRGDNKLRDLILFTNQREDWNDIIDFYFSESLFNDNFELFTNVDKLIKVYKQIIELIIEVKSKYNLDIPIVEFSFFKEENDFFFKIHHKNTIYHKLIDEVDRFGESLSSIINDINGLCDLYVKAEFLENQYADINIWDGKSIKVIELEYFQGVEYCLKFVKK